MYHYKSDATQFIDDYIEKHPQEAEQRLKNRASWHLLPYCHKCCLS